MVSGVRLCGSASARTFGMCEQAARTLRRVADDVFGLKLTVAHRWPSAALNFALPVSPEATPPASASASTAAAGMPGWSRHALPAGGIMAALIEDYALIGDMQSAALVSRDGSVDWLCVPRFDSPACLAALLGDESHGHWRISPTAADGPPSRRGQISRCYQDSTLILETEWQTVGGTVRVIDFMPPRGGEAPVLIRIVEGVAGAVEMECVWRLRFGYGSVVPWVRRIDHCIVAIAGPDSVWLRTPVRLIGHDLAHEASFTVRAGERVPFVFSWTPSH